MYHYYPSQVQGSRRRSSSLTTSSYHRPSPSVPTYGTELGLATKPVTKELGHQQYEHCMDYALHLLKQYHSGEV